MAQLVVCSALLAALLPTGIAQARDNTRATVAVLDDGPQGTTLALILDGYEHQDVAIDGRPYSVIGLGEESPLLEAGCPDLARVCRSIIVDDDAALALRIIEAVYEDFADVWVAPSKGSLPRTVNPEDVPFTFGKFYETDAFYPGALAELGEPYILRDFRGVAVRFQPLQYNPVTRTLRVYTRLVVAVTPAGAGGVNALAPELKPRAICRAFDQLYRKHFVNYAQVRPIYPPLNELGDLLIIAYDAWIPNVEPLVTHKIGAGFDTTIVGVSTIGNNSTAIKNYIQSVYSQGSLAFVLLVGDDAQVRAYDVGVEESDPSYALLAGGDHFPDIVVGRFSATTAAEVDTQVQRTIEYETLPAVDQAWFKMATGVASNQGPGDDGEYDNQHMDNIRADLLNYDYTVVDRIYDPSASAAAVSAALNAGRGFVNYCGHGSTTAWGTTGFSNSNVNALTNNGMLPFIVSVACLNGDFAETTCFAEAWLRATHNNAPSGAIAIYASSVNQDWNPPMAAQDEVTDLLCAEAYFSFGALCYAGSCRMMDDYPSTGPYMYDTWHVFGDPTVRVFGYATPPVGIRVAPHADFTAEGPEGGPFAPAEAVYQIENVGDYAVEYAVTRDAGANWIELSGATSGTLEPDQVATVTVAFGSEAETLPAGSYASVVYFTNLTDSEGNAERDVALEVGRYVLTSTDVPKSILDYTPVTSTLVVDDYFCIGDLDVAVDISHTYIGDIVVSLTSPTGQTVTLHNRSGGSTENIVQTYDDESLAPDGPGALSDFDLEMATGTWTLTISDQASGDTGTLNSWSLRILPAGDACPPVAYDCTVTTGTFVPVDVTLEYSSSSSNPTDGIILSLPAHATLEDPNGGAITTVPYTLLAHGTVVRYAPDWAYNGPDAFQFKVNDGADSNVANVDVTVGAVSVVQSFNMDTDPGWSTEGAWGWGQPTGGGSHNVDPTAGHTGSNVYGYNLSGDYTRNMPVYYLTTLAFDATYWTQTELQFWRWLGVEGTHDHATLDLSTDGETWTTLWANPATTISDSAWSEQVFDLSALADGQPTVYLRWGMGPTDGSVTYPGWNIDDVELVAWVSGAPYPLGDVNCDGEVNNADIAPFVLALSDRDAYELAYPDCNLDAVGDIDGDGVFNNADIPAFVDLLTGE